MQQTPLQNKTNHIALVLDASASMQHLAPAVVRTADELIRFLAEDSQEKKQETRVSVYTFSNDVTNHIWDMDVLRLPSMKGLYKIVAATALIDATMLALDDGDLIPEKYGDHAHLVYIITDGEENVSRGKGNRERPAFGRMPRGPVEQELKDRLAKLKDNRTIALLVPDDQGYRYARDLGFADNNIALWDATTEEGLKKAMETVKTATAAYTSDRATGLRGTKSLFVGANIDAQAIKAADLKPLPTKQRRIVRVTKTDDAFEKVVKPVTKSRLKPEMGWFVDIDKYVRHINKNVYVVGDVFYELVKGEYVAGDKEIAVVNGDTRQVYVGDGARQLLGLPAGKVRVKPEMNPDYEIYVQSLSLNRHLPVGSHIMLLTR